MNVQSKISTHDTVPLYAAHEAGTEAPILPYQKQAEHTFMNRVTQVLFWGIHLAAIAVIWVGVSPIAVALCFGLYFIRMFAITGVFHRYFSHRTYKTSRVFQFILGFLGTTAVQKGPLWWGSHHRHHHQHSDTTEDIHSAYQNGLWWSHIGWILSPNYSDPRPELIRDFTKYPEIQLLDKYHAIPGILLAVGVFFLGQYLGTNYPSLNTSGPQLLVWGFFISTTLLYHGTFMVNSITHMWGRKRFVTGDESRNSLLIALVTLGEGWHNNHHRYPGSEKQGFYWWEIDISHYILKVLSWFGLVWDLRVPPERIYQEARENKLAGNKFVGQSVSNKGA